MCVGIALAWSELPTELIERHGLERRAHERGGEREGPFLFRHPYSPRPLAAGREGRLWARRGGRPGGGAGSLPRPGGPGLSTVEAESGRALEPILVDFPATIGLERGVWFRIRQGIRGLLVPDERGNAVVYMICEPASHYYQVMTRSTRMPVLIEERI